MLCFMQTSIVIVALFAWDYLCVHEIVGCSGDGGCVIMCMCVAHYMLVCKQAWGGGIKYEG